MVMSIDSRGRNVWEPPLKMLERFWYGCGHCHGDEASCPFSENMAGIDRDSLTGVGRLPIQITAPIVFLLPLACGIASGYISEALWAEGSRVSAGYWQTGGLVAGTAMGAGLAKLLLAGVYRFWTQPDRGDE